MTTSMIQRRMSVEKCLQTLTGRTMSSMVTARVTHLNQKEERDLVKTFENIDLEKKFATSEFESYARLVKTNLKQFQNRTSKIKSKLTLNDITQFKDLEVEGKLHPMIKVRFSPSRKIATASRLMRSRIGDRHHSKSAFPNCRSRLQTEMESSEQNVVAQRHERESISKFSSQTPVEDQRRISSNNVKYRNSGLITDFGEIPLTPRPDSDQSRVYSAKTRSHKMLSGDEVDGNIAEQNVDESQVLLPAIQKDANPVKCVRIVVPGETASIHSRRDLDSPVFQREDTDVSLYPLSRSPTDGDMPKVQKQPVSILVKSPRTPTIYSNNQFSSHAVAEKDAQGLWQDRSVTATPNKHSDVTDKRSANMKIFEERRQELLKQVLAYNLNLEARKSKFMGDVEKMVIESSRRISVHPKEDDEESEAVDEARRLRRGRRPVGLQRTFTSEKEYRARAAALWKDMKKTRYLRLDEEDVDMTGMVTTAEKQLQMFSAMKSAPRRHLFTR